MHYPTAPDITFNDQVPPVEDEPFTPLTDAEEIMHEQFSFLPDWEYSDFSDVFAQKLI